VKQEFPVIIPRAEIEKAYAEFQKNDAQFAAFYDFEFGGEIGVRIEKMKALAATRPQFNKEALEKRLELVKKECEQFGIEYDPDPKKLGDVLTKLNMRKRYGPGYENITPKGPKQEEKKENGS
jgi:hypothetical protein